MPRSRRRRRPTDAVGVAYKKLPADVHVGDVLLLNDGQISLQVESIDGPAHQTRVLVGGELGNNKGINRQGGGLSAGALTDKDREDIGIRGTRCKVDYLAVSFARDAADMNEARDAAARRGRRRAAGRQDRARRGDQAIWSTVVEASDAVMVARGDLGVEMGYAELAGLQKQIIQEARHQNRVVITATQMMESMIAESDSDARRGLGRRQCGHGRHRCRHAVGRDRRRASIRSRWSRRWRRSSWAPRNTRARTCASASASTGHFERTDEAIASAVMYHGQPPARARPSSR